MDLPSVQPLRYLRRTVVDDLAVPQIQLADGRHILLVQREIPDIQVLFIMGVSAPVHRTIFIEDKQMIMKPTWKTRRSKI